MVGLHFGLQFFGFPSPLIALFIQPVYSGSVIFGQIAGRKIVHPTTISCYAIFARTACWY